MSEEIAIETAELGDDDQEVRLTLAQPLEKGRTYRYFVSAMEDASGEEMIPAAGYLVPGVTAEQDGFIRSVTVLDARRLEVVFAEEVQDKFSASNYGLVDQKSQRLVPMLV